MSDRKTVVEDLGLCLKGLCEYCSHKGSDAPGGCRDELIHAAMVELEQMSVKPVKKINKHGFKYYYCGHCNKILVAFRPNYCHNCGRAVKWDD